MMLAQKLVLRTAFRWSARLLAVVCVFSSTAVFAQSADDSFDCLIEPYMVASVGSPVQGVLAESLVDRGDSVKIGQPIARLEATSELANLEHARARARMASEVQARQADLKLAKVNLTRQAELKQQGLAPAQKYDEAVARHQVAQASLRQAIDSTELLMLEERQAQRRVDERTLKSPIDGVVVEQHTFPGEFVYDNPIMTIAQINPLKVEVVLPARLFGEFRQGDVAIIEPELAYSGDLLAMVDVVDRLLDTRSGTYGIRLTLPNDDLLIPGGQKCRLKFSQMLSEAAE